MVSLRIAPIVEGHGEVDAVGILLRRLVPFLCPTSALEVLKPIRVPRSKLVKSDELERAIRLARLKIEQSEENQARLILVLFDADDDKPCEMAPKLLKNIQALSLDIETSLVLADREFESWFVAAAESLDRYLDLGKVPASNREVAGKSWIERAFRGPKYSETVDQAKLTAGMDLELCRSRSSSFDKLCREIEGFTRRAGGEPW